MTRLLSLLVVIACFLLPVGAPAQKGGFGEIRQLQGPQNPRLGFVIHGGAGVIAKGSLTPEQEKEYKAKLEEAVTAGDKKVQGGKNSGNGGGDAVRNFGELPVVNAGQGAVVSGRW